MWYIIAMNSNHQPTGGVMESTVRHGRSGWYVYFVDGAVVCFETETGARWYSTMMALKNTKMIYRGHS